MAILLPGMNFFGFSGYLEMVSSLQAIPAAFIATGIAVTAYRIPLPACPRIRPRAALLAWLLLAVLALGAFPALAQEPHIVGRPRALDGDTLDFAGRTVDLLGIDAPEVQQRCGAAGAAWNCGLEARWALINRIGRHWVTCVPQEQPAAGPLRALCYLAGPGQLDVGQWLVAQGWALADGRAGERYRREEAAAQAARKGVWRGAFEAPWDWRKRHPVPSRSSSGAPGKG